MFIYHYHATKQLRIGEETHIDGIAQLRRRATNMDDYRQFKALIAVTPDCNDIGGPDGLIVRSLTLLHEAPN